MARHARYRPIALAISGGVDSMALAFLFASLRQFYPQMKIADNPLNNILGLVVDHNLRENSTEEASFIKKQVVKLGIKTAVLPMTWKEERRLGLHPPDLPNVESMARKYRYRLLAKACSLNGTDSLFFAHHRDDQYETILMRMLSGHGYRGFQGIRAANAVPECYDLHKIYKSGLLDDQRSKLPFLSFKPPQKEMKRQRSLYRQHKRALNGADLETYFQSGSLDFTDSDAPSSDQDRPYMPPLSCEDGGVTIYRPLLEFDKDRLIATCEANNVSWVEDATNKDPTFTTRNAIRYLVKHHELPMALQKPSVLAMSQRAKWRIKQEEGEVERLIIRHSVIKDFDSNVGTLLVQLPRFHGSRSQSRWSEAREKARIPHRRTIAGLLARKLIDYVTPEHTLPPLTSLDNVVDRLFPQISRSPQLSDPPKAFSIAGVLFSPVSSPRSNKWFLSRAPYPSSKALPEKTLPKVLPGAKNRPAESPDQVHRHVAWRSWKVFRQWDGRFWVHIGSCVNVRLQLAPLDVRCLKPFRLALPLDQRRKLEWLLKHHAPGKVRYALPAIYNVEVGTGYEILRRTLLALPSLGIHIPGMERWIKYEVRYRHVDLDLLGRQQDARQEKEGRPRIRSGLQSFDNRPRRRRRVRLETRLVRDGLDYDPK